MAFKDRLSTDLDIFFNTDEMASTITYNSSNIKAILDYTMHLDLESNIAYQRGKIYVKKIDVPYPKNQDSVLIGIETWKVFQVDKGDNDYVWEIIIQRDERIRP